MSGTFQEALVEQLHWQVKGQRPEASSPLRSFGRMVRGVSTYWVGEEIVGLLAESQYTFPPFEDVTREQPPTATGFVLLERAWQLALPEYRLHSFSWRVLPGKIKVGVAIRMDGLDPLYSEPMGKCVMFTLKDAIYHDAYDRVPEEIASPKDPILRSIRSFWAFTAQPIAAVAGKEVDRSTKRRIARLADTENATVNVVQLRAKEYEGRGDGGDTDSGRQFSCRWVVRAHWRNQPVGVGRSARRPVMVVAHVKGPKEAPLKARGVDLFAVVR